MIAEVRADTIKLFDQISQWAQRQKWTVQPKLMHVDLPNTSEALEEPGIRITTPSGSVDFEVAGTRQNGTTVVDAFAWPTLVRIRLFSSPEAGHWTPVTDVGMELRYDWVERDFVRLIGDMLSA
ncbi:MAG TPA: hypothetical protein VKT77_18880 [Chthonomonadaceae bacterium]|nr:hypothetical protein [Chthonomonadaceae bacterium]